MISYFVVFCYGNLYDVGLRPYETVVEVPTTSLELSLDAQNGTVGCILHPSVMCRGTESNSGNQSCFGPIESGFS